MLETWVRVLGLEDPWWRDRLPTPVFLGFSGGSDSQESTCNVGDLGLEDLLEKGVATYSSILAWRIPMDRGASWATVHGVAKSQTRLRKFHLRPQVSQQGRQGCSWLFLTTSNLTKQSTVNVTTPNLVLFKVCPPMWISFHAFSHSLLSRKQLNLIYMCVCTHMCSVTPKPKRVTNASAHRIREYKSVKSIG